MKMCYLIDYFDLDLGKNFTAIRQAREANRKLLNSLYLHTEFTLIITNETHIYISYVSHIWILSCGT